MTNRLKNKYLECLEFLESLQNKSVNDRCEFLQNQLDCYQSFIEEHSEHEDFEFIITLSYMICKKLSEIRDNINFETPEKDYNTKIYDILTKRIDDFTKSHTVDNNKSVHFNIDQYPFIIFDSSNEQTSQILNQFRIVSITDLRYELQRILLQNGD